MLDRIPSSRFDHGKSLAQKIARTNLQFILSNKDKLLRARGGARILSAMESISKQKEQLTDNQMNYIMNTYEKVWEHTDGFNGFKKEFYKGHRR